MVRGERVCLPICQNHALAGRRVTNWHDAAMTPTGRRVPVDTCHLQSVVEHHDSRAPSSERSLCHVADQASPKVLIEHALNDGNGSHRRAVNRVTDHGEAHNIAVYCRGADDHVVVVEGIACGDGFCAKLDL